MRRIVLLLGLLLWLGGNQAGTTPPPAGKCPDRPLAARRGSAFRLGKRDAPRVTHEIVIETLISP